jgi:hypothetical protein
MQSQIIRRVVFPSTYAAFLDKCSKAFTCELSRYGKEFKTYRMPPGVAKIDDRQSINEENYARLCEDMQGSSILMPTILLWSRIEAGNSQDECDYEDFQGFNSPSLRGSSTMSGKIKSKYEYHCLACKNDYQRAKSTINACRILEVEEVRNLSTNESRLKANNCGIFDIDDPRNYIPLCTTCHDHFEYQRLGIELKDGKYLWQVKPILEQPPMPHHPDNKVYGTLKGTEIEFTETARPPPKLITHRQERYNANISSRTKKRKIALMHNCCY